MKLLARYLLQEVARMSLLVLAALLGLFLFFDLIAELPELGKGSYNLLKMLAFSALQAPGHAYELLPIAVLIGGMFSLSLLNQGSELTVMRAGGLSMGRLLSYLMMVGLFFALLTFALGELVMPNAERAANKLRLAATGQAVAKDFRSGFWARDGGDFINVQEVLPDSSLRQLSVYQFDRARRMTMLIQAESGVWQESRDWQLRNVQVTRFSAGGTEVQKHAELNWRSILSPELLSRLLVSPEQMSAPALIGYIEHLQKNGQKTSRYEIALWTKLVYPLACFALLLMALPFASTQRRAGGVGIKLFGGIMLGLAFYFVSRLSSHLGLLYGWHPALAAISPSLIFLSLAALLLQWQERR